MNIRQKFIAALLSIGLIPTLIVGIVSYITISNQLNQRTISQLTSIDIKQQQAIATLLQTKQQEVIALAEEYDFQVALQQYLKSGASSDQNAVDAILNSKLSSVSGLSVIDVASPDGAVFASTDPTLQGSTLSYQPSAAGAYQGPEISIERDPTTGLDELYITTSLSVNDQYPATLRAVFSVSDLQAELSDYTGLGNTGETVISAPNQSGQLVSLFPLRFMPTAANIRPYQTLADGRTVSYMGNQVIVTTRPVGFSNWTISTMIDTSEALAPISDLSNALIIIFLASSLLIALLALYLARIFTGPIRTIADVSRRIGRGDFGVAVDVDSSDEIGDLAASINTMRDSLKAFVTGIESQRNQLAIVLNSTTDSILAVDQKGIIITANLAAIELAARPAGEIIGHPMEVVFGFLSETQPLALNYEAIGSSTYPKVEYTNPAGAKHYLRLIVAHLVGNDQQPSQSIITIRDETKSRELESMKLDFVSMAAHELRTPLAAIRGYIELIMLKLKRTQPDVKNYLQQALKSSVELSSLINNLLDVSRIERGTLTLNMAKTDLAASMDRAVRDVSFQAKERGIKLNYTGPDKGCSIAADEIAIREVITNLLTNAIKYTEPEGHIDATLETSGASYRIAVKDTGVGIPTSAMPHLFTKFFRVHGGLDSGSTGTGLGLFIAKSIVERHGGTIQAESKEGQGSTFSFTVPQISDTELAQIAAKEQTEPIAVRRHRGWVTKNSAR